MADTHPGRGHTNDGAYVADIVHWYRRLESQATLHEFRRENSLMNTSHTAIELDPKRFISEPRQVLFSLAHEARSRSLSASSTVLASLQPHTNEHSRSTSAATTTVSAVAAAAPLLQPQQQQQQTRHVDDAYWHNSYRWKDWHAQRAREHYLRMPRQDQL